MFEKAADSSGAEQKSFCVYKCYLESLHLEALGVINIANTVIAAKEQQAVPKEERWYTFPVQGHLKRRMAGEPIYISIHCFNVGCVFRDTVLKT